MKNIAILGSTGSIGTQSLDVIKNLDGINVFALAANKNIAVLKQQIDDFSPKVVCVTDAEAYTEISPYCASKKIDICTGMQGLVDISIDHNVDIVLNSLVGSMGLESTLAAVNHGKDIALANKETLVAAGELVMKTAKEKNVNIYPIDSEHSAIWQCLENNTVGVKKIILTASGGPFRERQELQNVTLEDALKHPNWTMGAKITIDSATLMNKGLEVIEARWLFDLDLEQIEVIVHPQSIIHSMVEYVDGQIIAQLGEHDMRLPIQYALTYPNRVKNNFPTLDFTKYNTLTFEKPRVKDFRCLNLAYEALKIGGTMPAVLNAANEVAVDMFLKNQISFLDIAILIEKTMNAHKTVFNYTIQDVFDADDWARRTVCQF